MGTYFRMEKIFETLLWQSRLVLIFAVISCVITGVCLIGLGIYEVLSLLLNLIDYLFIHSKDIGRDQIILLVVEILDTFLLSSVLFIFSFGLYELFISPIDNKNDGEKSKTDTSQAYVIDSIDQLKAKLGKVVVMLLVIKIFAFLVEITPSNMVEMVYLAIIVALVSLSLWLGHSSK